MICPSNDHFLRHGIPIPPNAGGKKSMEFGTERETKKK